LQTFLEGFTQGGAAMHPAQSRTNEKTSTHTPCYLLNETMTQEDGWGPVIETEPKALTVTLSITSALEQERLEVTVLGSPDGEHWMEKPLADFRKKSYCGKYELPLDLSAGSAVRHLRVKWRMSRWGGDQRDPLFGFYVALA
jgi:hypothetical protein